VGRASLNALQLTNPTRTSASAQRQAAIINLGIVFALTKGKSNSCNAPGEESTHTF